LAHWLDLQGAWGTAARCRAPCGLPPALPQALLPISSQVNLASHPWTYHPSAPRLLRARCSLPQYRTDIAQCTSPVYRRRPPCRCHPFIPVSYMTVLMCRTERSRRRSNFTLNTFSALYLQCKLCYHIFTGCSRRSPPQICSLVGSACTLYGLRFSR